MKNYPKWFEPSLWGCVFLLILTGIAIIPKALSIRFTIDLPISLADELSQLSRIGHAVFAFIFLFIVGSLWSIHMRHGWRKNQKRISGSFLVGSIFILSITALIFYYAFDDGLTGIISIIHIVFGILMPSFVLIHFVNRTQKPIS